MSVPLPDLPELESEAWYPWAQGLHQQASQRLTIVQNADGSWPTRATATASTTTPVRWVGRGVVFPTVGGDYALPIDLYENIGG